MLKLMIYDIMAKLIQINSLKDQCSNKAVEYKSIRKGNTSRTNQNNHTTSVEMLTEFSHEKQTVNITWRNLSCSVTTGSFQNKGKKNILQGVTGSAYSGMLNVILGPSGAGKTTLLNIISGFKSYSYKGEILVNGRKPSPNFYRDNSCIIPQEIYLFPHLTVKETIRIAAELKLPGSTSKSEKEQQVNNVMEMLRLTDVQSSRVNRLSGGEKKRLSIAQELVNNPPMMLLDEPTSGLDSSLSYQCIKLLVNLAREGRTIICTIHQPSSSMYEMFDNLHILSKGFCLYSGLGKDLTSFLSSCELECPQYYNPADYIIDIASGVLPGEEALLRKRKEDNTTEVFQMNSDNSHFSKKKEIFLQKILFVLMDNHHYPTSFFHQFWILISRQFWSTVGQPIPSILYLVAQIALSALIGLIYRTAGWNADVAIANIGLLALITIVLAFSAILPTMLSFPTEKMAVLREYHNGWYSVNSYFLARTVAGIPFNCLFPFVFITIVYWMTGQIAETWRYFYFIALGICLTLSVESIPTIVGALCSPKVTVLLVPSLCLPLLLFSKFFIISNKLPYYIDWVTKVSPFALFYEGIIMVIYGFDRAEMECSFLCFFGDPKTIMRYLNVNDKNIDMNFGILCATIVIFRIISYICLNVRIRHLK